MLFHKMDLELLFLETLIPAAVNWPSSPTSGVIVPGGGTACAKFPWWDGAWVVQKNHGELCPQPTARGVGCLWETVEDSSVRLPRGLVHRAEGTATLSRDVGRAPELIH